MLLAKKYKSLFISRSTNSKTGDVPQQMIGLTREASKKSCKGCPLLDKICYAQKGTVGHFGHNSAIKAHKRGKDQSLEYALKHRSKKAKIFRIGSIGQPSNSVDTRKAITRAKQEGLSVVGYDHNWKQAKWLKGILMASADTLPEAIEAISKGWRVYLHMKEAKIEGKVQGRFNNGKMTFTTCPHARTKVQCNDCRLCDASKKAVDLIITNSL